MAVTSGMLKTVAPTGLMPFKKIVFDANTVGAGLPAMTAYEPTILYAQSYIPRP
jgi:hypothetical protein